MTGDQIRQQAASQRRCGRCRMQRADDCVAHLAGQSFDVRIAAIRRPDVRLERRAVFAEIMPTGCRRRDQTRATLSAHY